jgi:hypothetical protein
MQVVIVAGERLGAQTGSTPAGRSGTACQPAHGQLVSPPVTRGGPRRPADPSGRRGQFRPKCSGASGSFRGGVSLARLGKWAAFVSTQILRYTHTTMPGKMSPWTDSLRPLDLDALHPVFAGEGQATDAVVILPQERTFRRLAVPPRQAAAAPGRRPGRSG